MVELETKQAIEAQAKCGSHFAQCECLKQIAINLARVVDRLDEIERSIWVAGGQS